MCRTASRCFMRTAGSGRKDSRLGVRSAGAPACSGDASPVSHAATGAACAMSITWAAGVPDTVPCTGTCGVAYGRCDADVVGGTGCTGCTGCTGACGVAYGRCDADAAGGTGCTGCTGACGVAYGRCGADVAGGSGCTGCTGCTGACGVAVCFQCGFAASKGRSVVCCGRVNCAL